MMPGGDVASSTGTGIAPQPTLMAEPEDRPSALDPTTIESTLPIGAALERAGTELVTEPDEEAVDKNRVEQQLQELESTVSFRTYLYASDLRYESGIQVEPLAVKLNRRKDPALLMRTRSGLIYDKDKPQPGSATSRHDKSHLDTNGQVYIHRHTFSLP